MAWTFYNASGEAMIEDGAMTIANNTNNRVVTATGADPASLNGESALTFDGEHLTVGDGNLVIGTAGHGIDFAAQTGTASPGTVVGELLDHYEVGTFTPFLADDSLDDTGGAAQEIGRYTRIGNRVLFDIKLLVNDITGLTTSQSARIAGFPFASANVSNARNSVSIGLALGLNIAAQDTVTGFFVHNTSYIYLTLWDAAAGITYMTIAEASDNADFSISGQYSVA